MLYSKLDYASGAPEGKRNGNYRHSGQLTRSGRALSFLARMNGG
jgi:hypothetical protein